MTLTYGKDSLVNLGKTKDTFVGIDSDGCVFDSMGVKHKNHFIPMMIKVWGLEKIGNQVRMAAEFTNLYSKWRGTNRFIALLKTFELLPTIPEVVDAGVPLPDMKALRNYVNSGVPLGNPSLSSEVEKSGDIELKRALEWSLAVNRDIDENMEKIPPFKLVRECLQKMALTSDLLVVSQTPEEALVKEWRLHGIDGHIRLIAGQELGTKTEHLTMVKGDRFPGKQILMIGDAPGDRMAAEAVGAWFFPINPGQEEASWKKLYDEGYARFLEEEFGGVYQQRLIEDFEALLPESPPWIG